MMDNNENNNKEKDVYITLHCDQELKATFKRLAKHSGQSLNDCMMDLILTGLTYDQNARESKMKLAAKLLK